MLKIAFCDDDMEVLHQMNELIDRYRVERKNNFHIRVILPDLFCHIHAILPRHHDIEKYYNYAGEKKIL